MSFDSVFHGAPASVGGQSVSSGRASLGIDVNVGQTYYRTPEQGAWVPTSPGPFAGDYYTYPPFEGNRSAGVFYPGYLNVAVMPVFLSRTMVLSNAKMSINAASTVSNVFYYFGIYNLSQQLLTSATFPIGLGTPTGIQQVALSTPVTLSRGMWLFCQGSDDTGSHATGMNYQFDTDLMNMIPGGGKAPNSIANGMLPSTLGGSIVEPWPDSAPYICLY
jgi:hypothetical protein